jgi:hypothetical protein
MLRVEIRPRLEHHPAVLDIARSSSERFSDVEIGGNNVSSQQEMTLKKLAQIRYKTPKTPHEIFPGFGAIKLGKCG